MNKQDEWDAIRYPSLTDDQNELIRRARRAGFALFYPAYPTGEDQDKRTLQGAKAYLIMGETHRTDEATFDQSDADNGL